MNAMRAYLRNVISDLMFVRVVMVLWSVPFVSIGIVALLQWRPSEPWEWFGLSFAVLIGVYGLFLAYAGIFGSATLVEKAAGFVAEGGDVLGVVLALVVAVVAIPVTIAIRAFYPKKKSP